MPSLPRSPLSPSDTCGGPARAYLERAEHVFGNLLQRLYALAEDADQGRPWSGADLAHTVARLENALRALFDYLDVPHGEFEELPAAEVVQSLATVLREGLGGPVPVALGPEVMRGRLLVDLRALPVAWRAVVEGLKGGRDAGASESSRGPEIQAEAVGGQLELQIKMPAGWVSQRWVEAELWWAMVAKVTERQGGELQRDRKQGGEITWSIRLPLVA